MLVLGYKSGGAQHLRGLVLHATDRHAEGGWNRERCGWCDRCPGPEDRAVINREKISAEAREAQLRKNHGKEEQRARDLFYALWIPDLFMKRVEEDGDWTLMCPAECPGLPETHSKEFEKLYKSFGIDAKVKKSAQLTRSYRIPGTPYVTVRGKYITGPSMVLRPEGGVDPIRFIGTLNTLIEKD